MSTRKRLFGVVVLAGLVGAAMASQRPAYAGGPSFVGGAAPGFGVDAEPFLWDTATPIPYRTDGPTNPNSLALGTLTKSQADARVVAMFTVWQDVATANITYTRAGDIQGVADGDVSTAAEFDTVHGTCQNATQNPIVYDRDGSLFSALNIPSNVIGFAAVCQLGVVGGVANRILSAEAVLNGKFQDGVGPPLELTPDEFNQAFTHEFGHFSGLDHSQINGDVLPDLVSGLCTDIDGFAGLPLMFPELRCQARVSEGLPVLAPDDIAWISSLYPSASFSTSFGEISGRIFFSDGVTQVQGANVIARQVSDGNPANGDESRRNAVSVVSGYLFTGAPGQSVTGTSPPSDFGSRDVTLIGFYEIPVVATQSPPGIGYTVEVESIDPAWVVSSGIGPLGNMAGEQFPLPGPPEFWNLTETETDDPAASDPISVTTIAAVVNIDITLNGTPDRFDVWESARLLFPEPVVPWLREERPPAFLVAG